MNIENKPLSQRIEELQKAQQSKPVSKTTVESIGQKSFEERRAVFEQNRNLPKTDQDQSAPEVLAQGLEQGLEQTPPETLQQRQEQLKSLVSNLPENESTSSGYTTGYEGSSSHETTTQPKSSLHDYLEDEDELDDQDFEAPLNQPSLKQSSPGQFVSKGYSTDFGEFEDDGEISDDDELEEPDFSGPGSSLEQPPKPEQTLNTGAKKGYSDTFDLLNNFDDDTDISDDEDDEPQPQTSGQTTSPQVVEGPGRKHGSVAHNHHEIESRQPSNVEGIDRAFEFSLRDKPDDTLMFVSKESQDGNLLHFGEQGVSRGQSQELLSTQTPEKGLWEGSKGNRMLFVMSQEGEIFAINPNQPHEHKGKTVMDVRIHHSSLLNGQDVAGAGEIQVSKGLTDEELEHLQTVVIEHVKEQIGKQNLSPEDAQKFFAEAVSNQLRRMLKEHQPGQIEVISDRSGHYRPDIKLMGQVVNELEDQGVEVERLNVELGDKNQGQQLPEGELMVPGPAIQSSMERPQGEIELRNIRARKQNLHSELLQKFKEQANEENLESIQATESKIDQEIERLNNFLFNRISAKDYAKVAVIYERLELLRGVELEPGTYTLEQNRQRLQEEKILEKISQDKGALYNCRPEVEFAYRELLEQRRQVPQGQQTQLELLVEQELSMPNQSSEDSESSGYTTEGYTTDKTGYTTQNSGYTTHNQGYTSGYTTQDGSLHKSRQEQSQNSDITLGGYSKPDEPEITLGGYSND